MGIDCCSVFVGYVHTCLSILHGATERPKRCSSHVELPDTNFHLLFSVFIFRLAYKINQIIGLILGLASATLLALEHAQGAVSLNMHAGLIVLATIGYGYNINLVKQYLAGIPAFVLSTVTVSLAGVLAFSPVFAKY